MSPETPPPQPAPSHRAAPGPREPRGAHPPAGRGRCDGGGGAPAPARGAAAGARAEVCSKKGPVVCRCLCLFLCARACRWGLAWGWPCFRRDDFFSHEMAGDRRGALNLPPHSRCVHIQASIHLASVDHAPKAKQHHPRVRFSLGLSRKKVCRANFWAGGGLERLRTRHHCTQPARGFASVLCLNVQKISVISSHQMYSTHVGGLLAISDLLLSQIIP